MGLDGSILYVRRRADKLNVNVWDVCVPSEARRGEASKRVSEYEVS